MIGAFDALWAVVLDDLNTNEWIANLGITLFALPLILLGSIGGRLAQRVGPFRVGTIGLLGGALFMALYGVVPTGGAMFAVAMVHAVNDGLTVSSTGVAVGDGRAGRAPGRGPGRARRVRDADRRHHGAASPACCTSTPAGPPRTASPRRRWSCSSRSVPRWLARRGASAAPSPDRSRWWRRDVSHFRNS